MTYTYCTCCFVVYGLLNLIYCVVFQGGVVVEQIFSEGVAAKDARLRVGDRILEINEVDITQKTFAQACLALGGTTPLLKLVIFRQSIDESISSDSKFKKCFPIISYD